MRTPACLIAVLFLSFTQGSLGIFQGCSHDFWCQQMSAEARAASLSTKGVALAVVWTCDDARRSALTSFGPKGALIDTSGMFYDEGNQTNASSTTAAASSRVRDQRVDAYMLGSAGHFACARVVGKALVMSREPTLVCSTRCDDDRNNATWKVSIAGTFVIFAETTSTTGSSEPDEGAADLGVDGAAVGSSSQKTQASSLSNGVVALLAVAAVAGMFTVGAFVTYKKGRHKGRWFVPAAAQANPLIAQVR
jgi:hypothetical protein